MPNKKKIIWIDVSFSLHPNLFTCDPRHLNTKYGGDRVLALFINILYIHIIFNKVEYLKISYLFILNNLVEYYKYLFKKNKHEGKRKLKTRNNRV